MPALLNVLNRSSSSSELVTAALKLHEDGAQVADLKIAVKIAVGFACILTLLAMLAYNHGVARIGAAKAGVVVHLMPVFASVFAVLVLNEPIRFFHAAGFALVVGGALLALFGSRQTRADLLSSPASKT